MGALLIKSIGNDPFRDLVARKRFAHCDQGDCGKLQTNRRKQLEPRHARHLQIGDYDVGKNRIHLKQSRESIPSCSHSVSSLSQQRAESYTQVTVILHKQDGRLMGGHKSFPFGAAGVG
jgi:hypothetical protein